MISLENGKLPEKHLGSSSIFVIFKLQPDQTAFTCSRLTMETLEQGVFIVNFEHISHLVLVFLLLALNL